MSEPKIVFLEEYKAVKARPFDGAAVVSRYRSIFGASIWLEGKKIKLQFPFGYVPSYWSLAFFRCNTKQIRLALLEEDNAHRTPVDVS